MHPRRRMEHVKQFQKYCPKMEGNFQKPASSGRKPHERSRVRKHEAEIIVDRMRKPEKVKIQDPNIAWNVVYELHLRSIVPRKLRGVR